MPLYSINDVLVATTRYPLGLEGDERLFFECYDVFVVDFIQQINGVFYYYERARRNAYPETSATTVQ